MKTVQEIKSLLSKHKEGLMKQYKIKELGIFGSYVRGEQKRGSDIDILVEFDEIPDIFQLIDLEDHLRKLLKKKVDLVRKGAIRPELKDVILKEAVYL
ncbi:MAG: nucleotidyltransferase family protein [archaeon]|nr:nucleotidyltransferase family protein [archaeon]